MNCKQELRYLYVHIPAALFTVAKRWEQLKCPPMDDQVKKMWSIHTMEYYSALKRKEILDEAGGHYAN